MSEGKKPFTGGFKTKQKTRQRAEALVCLMCFVAGCPQRLGSSRVESVCPLGSLLVPGCGAELSWAQSIAHL